MGKITRSDLLSALESVKGAVAAKNFQPILTHVLVADDVVLGFNSEIGVRVKMPRGCGSTFNVKFDPFYNLVRALEAETIDITVKERQVGIVAGTHRSTLTQLDEEFPKPNVTVKKGGWFTISPSFRDAVERAISALPKDDKDREMGAVFVSGERLYATDRQRAVRCTLDGQNLPAFMLPAKAAEELAKLGNPKRAALTDSMVVFDYGNLLFLALLREGAGSYPVEGFDRIMDARGKTEAVQEGLASALTRLMIFALTPPCAKLRIEPKAGLVIEAEGATSWASETLEAPARKIEAKGFAPDKLLAALEYADGIDWGARAEDPIYLKGENAGFEFILAPMRM